MADNYFELVGRLGWNECEYKESGLCITKITLGVKTFQKDEEGNPIYNNYFITFVDPADSKTRVAEEIADRKKGEYIRVKGVLKMDTYIPKNSVDGKKVSTMSLLGKQFSLVEFDQFEKRFIDVQKA